MKKLLLSTVLVMLALAVSAGEPYKAGDYASDFSLKNVDGTTVTLSQMENAKGFIVMFICNTCPVVKQYETRIMDLHKKFSDKGYPVIAINSNDKTISPGDSFEEMKKLAMAKKYGFRYLYDETQEVVKKYGATNTPQVFLLSKKGDKFKVEYIGAIDNNADNPAMADKKYVEDAVNALLRGEQVIVTKTKAVGCSVKLKKA
jgi:peroxiredoxin